MPTTDQATAPQIILDLVDRFEEQLDSYKSGRYNETQLRRDFLDPFFKTLGWDIDNESGYAEAYRDVIHEDALRIGGVVKAPDYCVEGTAPRETEPQLEVPVPSEPVATRAPRRRRAKGADAGESSAPAKPGINPDSAWADAAHYYGKEEPLPYGKEQP